jgi:ATP-binding cassette subfamily F protein uup
MEKRPDDGTLQLQQNLRIAYVAQEPCWTWTPTCSPRPARAWPTVIELVDLYHSGAEGWTSTPSRQIEAFDGWNWEQRVEETLHRLHLDPEARIGTLSGGTRKRVALAQALVRRPTCCCSTSPPTTWTSTPSSGWSLLIDFKGSVVTITHDRSFLDRVATRIVELDRGKLRLLPRQLQQYLLKEEQLAAGAVISAKADKLLAQEEVWIRKGVEARRTRSQSRIVRLQELRASRQPPRAVGRVSMDVASGQSSGKIVAELTEATKSFGEKTVIRNFSAPSCAATRSAWSAPTAPARPRC